MNNKGLTLVELITTFALTAVIVVLLINIVVVIKNVYSKTNIKTELYINQSNLSNVLNSKINDNNLVSYEICADNNYLLCVDFVLKEEEIRLSVTEKEIKFGEYVYKLKDKTKVDNPSLNNTDNDILVINIPIINELYPNIDFGVNLVYLYNIN